MLPGMADLKAAMELVASLKGSVDALKTEMQQRRRLGASVHPWDQHVQLTAASGADASFDLVRLYGKVAVRARVVDSGTGGLVAYNSGEAFTATTGNVEEAALIQNVRLDNRAGSGTMKVVVYLVAGAALGSGAKA